MEQGGDSEGGQANQQADEGGSHQEAGGEHNCEKKQERRQEQSTGEEGWETVRGKKKGKLKRGNQTVTSQAGQVLPSSLRSPSTPLSSTAPAPNNDSALGTVEGTDSDEDSGEGDEADGISDMEEVTDDDDTETDRKRKKEREDRKEEKKRQKQQTKKNKKAKKARDKKEKEKRRKEKEAIEKAAKASSPSKVPQQIASADILTENILPGTGTKRTRSKHKEKNGEGKQMQADTEHKETDGGKGSRASEGATESKQGIEEEELGGEGGTEGSDRVGRGGSNGDEEKPSGRAKRGARDEEWTESGSRGGNRGGRGRGRRGGRGGKGNEGTPSMLDYVARSPDVGNRRARAPGTTPEDPSKKARRRPPDDPDLELNMNTFGPGVSRLIFQPNQKGGGEPNQEPEALQPESEAMDLLDDYARYEEPSDRDYTDDRSLGEGGGDY